MNQGAFGCVWKALWKQEGRDRTIALKRVTARDEFEKRAAKNEIEILSCLNHDHIVTLSGYYMKDDNCFLVMEYCDSSLKEYLQYHTSIAEIRAVLIAIADGLAYAASRHIVHHDLKVMAFSSDER